MTRRLISQGSEFEELAGYSRAVVDGEWVFVAGTSGFDYAKRQISDDPVEQTKQTFRNIDWALGEAGASFADVVRIVIYVADQADFPRIVGVIGEHCREARPANTTVIAPLVDPRIKVEIEVTARKSRGGEG